MSVKKKTAKRASNDKANMPSKTCATCSKPFAWRKKWARDWETVKYCSDRCARGK